MSEGFRRGFKRTRQLNVRCTPAVCEMIKALAEQDDCSEADVVEALVIWAYGLAWSEDDPKEQLNLSVVA